MTTARAHYNRHLRQETNVDQTKCERMWIGIILVVGSMCCLLMSLIIPLSDSLNDKIYNDHIYSNEYIKVFRITTNDSITLAINVSEYYDYLSNYYCDNTIYNEFRGMTNSSDDKAAAITQYITYPMLFNYLMHTYSCAPSIEGFVYMHGDQIIRYGCKISYKTEYKTKCISPHIRIERLHIIEYPYTGRISVHDGKNSERQLIYNITNTY